MDHALDPHRQLAQGSRRTDGEGSEKLAGQLHEGSFQKADLPFRGKQSLSQVNFKVGLKTGIPKANRAPAGTISP